MNSTITDQGEVDDPGMTTGERLADRRFQARIGVLTQIVFAVLIAGVSFAAGRGDPEPDFLPRPLVLFGIYALIGAAGWIGIARHRPGVLFAASSAAGLGSIIAFSGVTLIFLVPASLMGVGAIAMLARGPLPADRSVRGGLTRAIFPLAQAVLVFALLVAAGWSALFVTDKACWTIRDVPGGVEIQPTAYTNGEIAIPADGAFNGVGCAEGLISARGVGGGVLLGLAALTLALLPRSTLPLSNRRRSPQSSEAPAADA